MNENAKNCWEYWNCPDDVRHKCNAFLYKCGRECWMVTGTATKQAACPLLKNKYAYCWECPWFKKLNPHFNDKK